MLIFNSLQLACGSGSGMGGRFSRERESAADIMLSAALRTGLTAFAGRLRKNCALTVPIISSAAKATARTARLSGRLLFRFGCKTDFFILVGLDVERPQYSELEASLGVEITVCGKVILTLGQRPSLPEVLEFNKDAGTLPLNVYESVENRSVSI